MELADKAVANFYSGYNCAQAVTSVFWEEYGIDPSIGFRMTSEMGSGFKVGSICGAASGGAIVIGLAYGTDNPFDPQLEEKKNHGITQQFLEEFKNRNGDVSCYSLLGITPQEKDALSDAKKIEAKLFCSQLVRSTVELLTQLGC